MLYVEVDSMTFRISLTEFDRLKNIKIFTIKHHLIQPTKQLLGLYYACSNGRPYSRVKRATSVFVVEHERGQKVLAIQWHNSGCVDISVHGIIQFNKNSDLSEDAIQRRLILVDLLKQVHSFKVIRVDFSMDMKKVPPRIIKRFLEKREAKIIGETTTYFQPKKQNERENPSLKIMVYDKAKKDCLVSPLMRIEFAIKGRYWKNITVTLDTLNKVIFTKGLSIIKRWTKENVEVKKLLL